MASWSFVRCPGPVLFLDVGGCSFDMRACDLSLIFDEFIVQLNVDRIPILLPRTVCIGPSLIRIGQGAIGKKIEYVSRTISISLHNVPGSPCNAGDGASRGWRGRIQQVCYPGPFSTLDVPGIALHMRA